MWNKVRDVMAAIAGAGLLFIFFTLWWAAVSLDGVIVALGILTGITIIIALA